MRTIFYALLIGLALMRPASSADGAAIEGFLNDATIRGDQNGVLWHQTFESDGQTVYTAIDGRPTPPSHGRWAVRGDQYCSVWPPSDRWECYDVTIDGENITFFPVAGGAPWPSTRVTP